MRAAERADERQMSEVRADLHDLVDRICDAWPLVQKHAREMTRGFPSSSLAGGGGGSSDSAVERALEQWDPAQAAEDALTEFTEARSQLKLVAKRFARLTVPAPLKPAGDAVTECDRCRRLISGTVESDPNRSGFCSECFGEWVRLGRPERIDFVKWPTCVECGRVTPRFETLEMAGERVALHHRDEDTCYWRAYNRSRGRRGA